MVKCAILLFNSAYLQCKHVPCVTHAAKITIKIVKIKIEEKHFWKRNPTIMNFLFHFNSKLLSYWGERNAYVYIIVILSKIWSSLKFDAIVIQTRSDVKIPQFQCKAIILFAVPWFVDKHSYELFVWLGRFCLWSVWGKFYNFAIG